jgi:hypothetical protein
VDDEGRRLAGLSDDEWAKHVRKLEREIKRDSQPPSSPRRGKLLVAVAIFVVAAAVTGVGLLRHHNASPRPAAQTPGPSGSKSPGGPFDGTPAKSWPSANVGLVMPAAAPAGPYSAAVVKGALTRARSYLLTARTAPAVLVRHDLNALASLADPTASRSRLYQTFLAPGNTLAAPVRVSGPVTYAFVSGTTDDAEHLAVTGNLVWAYALNATYPVEQPYPILVRHEHITLSFYLDAGMDGPQAAVHPAQETSTTYNMDCAYANAELLGLPRVDDPNRVPEAGDSTKGAFNPNQPVDRPGRGCTK